MTSLWTWAHAGAVAAQFVALGLPGPHSTTASPAAAPATSPTNPSETASADAADSKADSPSPVVALLRLAPAGSDKAVHATLFAAATFTGICAGLRPAVVIGTQLALAPATEVAQGTVIPRRGGSAKDVVADVVGIALGATAALLLRRR
ncbi:MAG: hypothetical protein Q4B12_08935 [Bowdeniella nasicola]|nr:hypothetical protein [Bowdeniella nasicola]